MFTTEQMGGSQVGRLAVAVAGDNVSGQLR